MYAEIIIYIVVGFLFVAGGLFTASLIRPSRPNEEKNTAYESGEDPVGDARVSFPIRYYIIALIFLLFEVEIIFLFPWALVFGDEALNEATNNQWGWLALAEMFLFLFVLAVGLAYAWNKGFLDWEKPQIPENTFKGPVPVKMYEDFNKNISDGTAG